MTNYHSELTLDDIIPFLDGVKKKANGGIVATCPICGKPGHFYADQKDGKLLMYCQRCNAPGKEFFKALRDRGAKGQELDYKTAEPVEDYRHIYRNPDGSEAYYKRRRKWANGHKVFSFAYRDENGRAVYTKPSECNNLYNLDLLAKADASTILYIVEGEKCADSMTKVGLLATTTNTGAQKNLKLSAVDKELVTKFSTKILIPDNDVKGADYASAWAWAGVKILPLGDVWPDCPEKGDIADFLEAGGDIDLVKNYQWQEPVNLNREFFENLGKFDLVDNKLFEAIMAVDKPEERQQMLTFAGFRATELGIKRDFDKCWKAYLQAQAAKGIKSDNMTNFPSQPFALRCGQWYTGATGVYRTVQVGTDFKSEYASPIPIMPVDLLCNVEDETEKLKLAYLKNGSWRHILVNRSKIANKNRILDLADFGVEVNSDNAGLLVKYIADAVALNPDILPISKSIDHMGWHEQEFIPFAEDIKMDCEDQYKNLIGSIREKGTLAEWVEFVKPMRENIYLRLIMSASFASPLIEKVGALPFVLHLWGGTGSGKTVGAMVAASIWGNPTFGRLMRTMNMTVNSMMGTASVLRNIPFFGDELQTIKSRYENYDTLIMRVCEGVDRGRMQSANGATALQKQKTWCNSFIFTGEEPCTKMSSGGGVKNRVIEIECDRQVVANGNTVVNFVAGHYGCASKPFLEQILQEKDLAQDYSTIMKMVMDVTGTTEKQAMAMALMLMADAIASRLFWPNEQLLSAEDIAPFVKSIAEVDVAERAYRLTIDIIAENREKFDTDFDDSRHTVWGKISGAVIYINKSVLSRELESMSFDFDAVKKKWAEKGYLLKSKDGRYIQHQSVAGVKGYYVALVQM